LAKVYVSSTIADLTEERRAVLDWLRLARHQAVDSYLADSDTVRDSCLDDVAACDLYVLLLGHRYGFQPPENNPEGLSITQLEFRRAGECGIPRVALLRTSIPDVSLSDLAEPQRLALVSGFRDEVARQVRPAEFSDLQGLIQGLSTGIQGQLDKLAKRDEGQAAPVTAGRVLRLAPRPVFLAGRDELLADLDTRLTAGPGAGPRVVALYGLGCWEDERDGGVRAPASGRGRAGLAVPRRGHGGAGGRVRSAGGPARCPGAARRAGPGGFGTWGAGGLSG
jgi:hypothetical protein